MKEFPKEVYLIPNDMGGASVLLKAPDVECGEVVYYRHDQVDTQAKVCKWVSVAERLPNEGHWYIAYSCNQVIELFYDGENEHGVHWLKEGDWGDQVTHWMHFPPPPITHD